MNKYCLFLLLFTLVSCTAQSAPYNDQSSKFIRERDPAKTLNKIEQQFIEWRGTPYRYGGTTRKGIDCSAFISLTARKQFNISLPRTVAEQAKLGVKVVKNKAKPGDLVFFKTGRNRLHVGIYYKNNNFLHVSTSKGVMFSSLNENYWKKRYWQIRRL